MSKIDSYKKLDKIDNNTRLFGLILNTQNGKIELRKGNYHCSKSFKPDLCVPCDFVFCSNCEVWKTKESYIGKYKAKGNSCADCRDLQYNPKRTGSLSVKIRFQVFKRDSFTCQYCGRSAPNVILHADHIHPVSKGGDNSLENLTTACQECNLGKSDSA